MCTSVTNGNIYKFHQFSEVKYKFHKIRKKIHEVKFVHIIQIKYEYKLINFMNLKIYKLIYF